LIWRMELNQTIGIRIRPVKFMAAVPVRGQDKDHKAGEAGAAQLTALLPLLKASKQKTDLYLHVGHAPR